MKPRRSAAFLRPLSAHSRNARTFPFRVDNDQMRAEVTIIAQIAWQVASDYFVSYATGGVLVIWGL